MTRRHRQTSAIAYRRLVIEGGLTARLAQAWALAYHHGPGTTGELERHQDGSVPKMTRNDLATRYTTLRDEYGLMQELGTKKCTVTGNSVIEWDVTDKVDPLPLKRVKKSPSKQAQYLTLLLQTADDLMANLFTVKQGQDLDRKIHAIIGKKK